MPTPEPRWKPYAYGFAVLALTIAVFSGVIGHDWVVWDDDIHFYKNPNYFPVTVAHLERFWTSSYKGLYVPLFYTLTGILSLAARPHHAAPPVTDTGALLDPHVFHFTSVLIHGLNTLLVFALARRVTGKDIPSLLGALVFGLHPFQVESVAWASELRGLTSAFFALLCLNAALPPAPDRPSNRPIERAMAISGAITLGICACLCKPSAVVLPILIVCVAAIQCRSWRRGILETLPVTASLILAAAVLSLVARQSQYVTGYGASAVWERPFIAGDALSFYLWKFFVPFGLGLDYGRSPRYLMDHWWRSVTWLAPAVFAVVALDLTKRFPPAKRWTGPVLLLSLAALLPVLGFVPFVFQSYSTVADRYAYLALIGSALAVSNLAASLDGSQRPARVKTSCLIACSLWLIVLGVETLALIPHWQNTAALARRTLAVNPDSVPGEVLQERAQQMAPLSPTSRNGETQNR